ncbi:hypothetical protein MNBD_NITROSPINAE04-849 [hydrothermal vent metagenome]|uniref:Uncharacterized protein n=1 Tax=hydrothermal vent metagenome TaxID=652676 RepID=A0A3B1C2B6_9ZZZZ
MAADKKRRHHTLALRKSLLGVIAELYLFPQTDEALAQALAEQFPDLDTDGARDCFSYLEKKGYVETSRAKERRMTARITAKGIDLVEGAVTDRGILSARPDFTGLALKRSVRSGILAYCRQFPDSFNGDDEILAELKELGMGALIIEQVRYSIWYLSEKSFLELKTHPLKSDLVFFARITAKGIDLVEGGISDPGVMSASGGEL